jgi:hypothetical protein
MSYSYTFSGHFRIEPRLTPPQVDYLGAFADTRRMKRNAKLLTGVPDPLREAARLPLGHEGCYFVGTSPSPHGESHLASVVDMNVPPAGQPSLWCQWVPNDEGDRIGCDEGEKFHFFDEWLSYLIDHFFKPWGCRLTGNVQWQGDDDADRGTLVVRDKNAVDVLGAIAVRKDDELRRLNVFLCHASEDKRRVRALGERLRDDNIDVWVDDKRLLPGSDWELAIRHALRAADAVIVCLSPESVKKRGFVQKELRMALAAAEEQPEGELFVFPVRLVPCEVPDSLPRWHWLDLGQRGAYGRLLAALAARAGSISN